MKKEESERARKIQDNIESEDFCPLTKGICRKDCVCYQKAYVSNPTGSENDYSVNRGYCGNSMFSNECGRC